MKENGVVCAVKDREVLVKLKRHSACLACRACSIGTDGEMVIKAIPSDGVGKGDRVTVEIDSIPIFKAILVVYLLPAVAFLSGVLTGTRVSSLFGIYKHVEILSVFIGLSFLSLAFFLREITGLEGKMPIRRGLWR